jgi:hypothetical protein
MDILSIENDILSQTVSKFNMTQLSILSIIIILNIIICRDDTIRD